MAGRGSSLYGSLSGRNGLTLRSVGSNNMLLPVSLFRTGVACCLPTCAQGLSVPVTGDFGFGFGVFWAFCLLLSVLYIWGLLVFLVSLLCTKLGLCWCASNWARFLGVVWLVQLPV